MLYQPNSERHGFNGNMYNFKFNFLWQGQLESLNLDKIFLALFKLLPCYKVECAEIIFKLQQYR